VNANVFCQSVEREKPIEEQLLDGGSSSTPWPEKRAAL